MFENFFADPASLFLGAFTGLAFGFLLQKGGVTRYEVIVGQFLLRDFTVTKIMGTAIAVGAVGIYGMNALGLEFSFHIKQAALLGNLLGGLLFGVGMALLGYCPGTGVAAMGEGSRHAIFGVAGMLAGAAGYAEAYPVMKASVLGVFNIGKATLATVTGFSPLWFIVILVGAAVYVPIALGRWERKTALITGEKLQN